MGDTGRCARDRHSRTLSAAGSLEVAEAIFREKPGGKEGQGEGCFHNKMAQGQAFRSGGAGDARLRGGHSGMRCLRHDPQALRAPPAGLGPQAHFPASPPCCILPVTASTSPGNQRGSPQSWCAACSPVGLLQSAWLASPQSSRPSS